MKLGNSNITKAYLGSTELQKIYLGTDLIYSAGPPPPSARPLAEWKFDGDFTDSENSYDGTSNGDVVFVDGINGTQAAFFDKSEPAWVDIPSNSAFGITTMSIMCWIYLPSYSKSWRAILEHDRSSNNWYSFGLSGTGINRIDWRWANGGTGAVAVSSSDYEIPTNQWTHIAGTFNGTSGRVYVNGVEVIAVTTSIINPTQELTTNALRIGSHLSGGDNLNAAIQNLKLFSGGLTASEVQEWYDYENQTVPTPTLQYYTNRAGALSFETNTANGWLAGGSNPAATVYTSDFRSGKNCLLFTAGTPGTEGFSYIHYNENSGTEDLPNWQTGDVIRFSCYLKFQSTVGTPKIWLWNDSTRITVTGVTNSSWTYYEADVTVTQTSNCRLYVYTDRNLLIDDITMVKIN